jgi:hypothetical protein
MLRSYWPSCWLAIGLSLAGACLNPRPEDFPSVDVSAPLDDSLPGSPADPQVAGPGSGGEFSDNVPPSPPASEPSAPTKDGDNGDAGAPPSDGGAAAAAAAVTRAAPADSGAARQESADGCDSPPDPR